MLDFDLDGDFDIDLLRGRVLGEGGDPSLSGPATRPRDNRLFENRVLPHSTLQFEDTTHASGLGSEATAMGVAVGDYDSDRGLDM